MRTYLLLLSLLSFATSTNAQNGPRETRFPVWTFQQKNVTIYGISAGFITLDDGPRNVRSNGLRIEPVGLGLLLGFMGNDPIAQTDEEYVKKISEPLSEKINGINLSPAGTLCDCDINGFSGGIFGQLGRQVNGVSVSMINIFQSHNGMQIGGLNTAYSMNGLQLALFFNSATKVKGVQIGFLNNSAENATGLQIALYNNSRKLKGVQIGVWNVNQKRKLPLINWNFN